MNKNSTRYYSNQQEKRVAKTLKGKKQSNSGATNFQKGDCITDLFLLECKTKMKDSESFTIKKEWFTKNKEEAFAMGKLYNAVVIDFGDNAQSNGNYSKQYSRNDSHAHRYCYHTCNKRKCGNSVSCAACCFIFFHNKLLYHLIYIRKHCFFT